MPGPKLTKEQKVALRKDIGEQVASQTKLAEIVKGLSEKYRIGANAIRWHHKKVVGGSAPQNTGSGKRGRPKGSINKKPVKNLNKIPGRGRPSSFRKLAAALAKVSPADLRRAIKASRLQLKHDALITQATHLRQQLKGTERRARVLERRIARALEA
jgi:hypothetical protein